MSALSALDAAQGEGETFVSAFKLDKIAWTGAKIDGAQETAKVHNHDYIAGLH